MLNILIIGSGAREHAIAKALARSPQTPRIFCWATSCNPGINKLAYGYHVGLLSDSAEIVKQAAEWKIDFAIIGPEAPLEQGLADLLWENNIPVVGPKKVLAQIETSKSFTRDLVQKYGILGSPRYKTCHDLSTAHDFLQELGENNYVIKADGLMGGKGVKVAGDHLYSLKEAYEFCVELHEQQQLFVIEEKCIGQEFSLMCFCDGTNLVPMPLVQDHKRAFAYDQGPNTGGMGSYSDANHLLPFLTVQDVHAALSINQKVIAALNQEFQEKFIGILYGSFMVTHEGVRLIEFNARFGDPEAMNVLAILESDFVEICQAMIEGRLSHELVKFSKLATVCKYAVPDGYPTHPVKNELIDVSKVENQEHLYFASIDERDGKLYATGSRAVAIVGVANTIAEAEKIAEADMQRIVGSVFHRPDIGTEELIYHRVQQMQALRQCVV